MRPTAQALGNHFTTVDYDRRGRGDSGDTLPYAVDRELEDLDALIGEVGGPAHLYGHSSGAGLVLRAVAAGLPVDRFVLHDPPYSPTTSPPGRRREASPGGYVACSPRAGAPRRSRRSSAAPGCPTR